MALSFGQTQPLFGAPSSPSPPVKERHVIDFASTFTIVLEDTGKRYVVHTDQFRAESPFFKRCLEKGFAEGQNHEVVVREERDEEAMQQLIIWVYAGTAIRGRYGRAASFWKALDLDRSQLTKLYLLADRFLMACLKNDVLDQFRWKSRSMVDLQPLEQMLQRRQESCQLKRFLIDHIGWELKATTGGNANKRRKLSTQDSPWQVQLSGMFGQHPDLASDLLTAMIHGDEQSPAMASGCVYHKHPEAFKKCSRLST